ncbi:MAG: TauD/TfdA family dioxygenase [Idiomarina sp.]
MIKLLTQADTDSLSAELLGLRKSDYVLHIPAGTADFERDSWYQFLLSLDFLKPDRRHFDVSSKLDERDWWAIAYDPEQDHTYAHSKTTQPFHTDNAWFESPPELNFFLLEKQAPQGGHQLIYPACRLVDDLQKLAPQLLDDLTSTVVTIRKGEDLAGHRTPIIKLQNDEVKVYWNYYRVEKEDPEIKKLCDTFFQFLEQQMSSASVIRLASKSGDAFCFNDSLLLHARESFVAEKKGDRVLLQSMWHFVD